MVILTQSIHNSGSQNDVVQVLVLPQFFFGCQFVLGYFSPWVGFVGLFTWVLEEGKGRGWEEGDCDVGKGGDGS